MDVCSDKLIAVIQIDSRVQKRRFTKDDLKLLVSVAGQIAVYWENQRQRDAIVAQKLAVQEMHILATGIGILFLADLARLRTGRRIEVLLKDEMLWFRWSVLLILLFMTVILGIYGPGFDAKAFIYFQF